jgi:CubicO group peptidase (beta-lactamase class C family)
VIDDRTAPPSAAELGLMQGTPPPADRLVTLDNWMLAPFNRWGLQHLDELVPTSMVRRGPRVWELPEGDGAALDGLTFDVDGEPWTLEEWLVSSATDGLVVLHRGAVIWERYLNGLEADTLHLSFSVTKSVVATIAGVLVARGLLDPEGLVTDVLPELAGTSWDGATVRQVLDMRTGTRFAEIYGDDEGDTGMFAQAIGWNRPVTPGVPADTYAFLAAMQADRPHGGAFDYRSPLSSMLGWLCERATGARLPDLLSRELWAPMGAQHDARIAVDAAGTAFAGGGFCAALRDLARLGELWRRHGEGPDGSLVPEAWVADTWAGGPDSREAYAASDDEPDPDHPEAFYRNQWWVLDPPGRMMTAIGIHGQWVTIVEPAELVVARVSSQALADHAEEDRRYLAAVDAIARALTAGE